MWTRGPDRRRKEGWCLHTTKGWQVQVPAAGRQLRLEVVNVNPKQGWRKWTPLLHPQSALKSLRHPPLKLYSHGYISIQCLDTPQKLPMHPNALQLRPQQVARYSVICFLEIHKTRVQWLLMCFGLFDEGANDEGLVGCTMILAETRLPTRAQLVLLSPFHKFFIKHACIQFRQQRPNSNATVVTRIGRVAPLVDRCDAAERPAPRQRCHPLASVKNTCETLCKLRRCNR